LRRKVDWILRRKVDWIRGLAIAIVIGLLWFANLARPVQIPNATSQLSPSNYIGSFSAIAAGHVDHGSVPLQVTGMLSEYGAYVDKIELDTRPSGQSPWRKQACSIAENSFSCSTNLTVVSALAFDFQLVSIGDNTMLANGTLAVHLESFPGGSQLAINIIAGLGLIAVVLPILRLVFRRRAAPEPGPIVRQGEPNAKEQ